MSYYLASSRPTLWMPTCPLDSRDPLPPPSACTYTTHELHKLIHEGGVDLSPPYQRGASNFLLTIFSQALTTLQSAVVWSREKQITLIESIFRNFYIPPVLFFVREETELDDAEDSPVEPLMVCMDGKQRLSSIQAFFDGQVGLLLLAISKAIN